MKWLNLGGGHHITREGYDIDGLVELVKYFREKYGVEVYLEPGEAIAIGTGMLVARCWTWSTMKWTSPSSMSRPPAICRIFWRCPIGPASRWF